MTEIIAHSRPTIALSAITGKPGHVGERRHRNADRAERDRRGVGEQADAGGVERVEAEAREHRARHGDRRAESGGALDERAERERDEHRLQTAIVGQAADRVLDDLELAGIDRQPVQHDRAEHDPRDRKQSACGAVDRRDQRQLRPACRTTKSATSSAEPSADSAAIHAGLRSTPSMTNRTTIGTAATAADAPETAADRLVVVLPHGCEISRMRRGL